MSLLFLRIYNIEDNEYEKYYEPITMGDKKLGNGMREQLKTELERLSKKKVSKFSMQMIFLYCLMMRLKMVIVNILHTTKPYELDNVKAEIKDYE